MAKPILKYVTHFGEGPRFYLNSSGSVMREITMPLAGSGNFHFNPDSEIIQFHRDPYGMGDLSCHIASVDRVGEIGPTICYFSKSPEVFLDRTRDEYVSRMSSGLDIFPIVPPRNDQKSLHDGKEFPDLAQVVAFEQLFKAYIELNSDPHKRLAIVDTTTTYSASTLDTFLSIASQFCVPVKIEVPKKVGV
ncbi:hypothetical protein GOV12_04575 [Candidatus Pacearchaeota archaeon]|nr:hypothetical protein [Candidatus Pacearchaeota archaeon]